MFLLLSIMAGISGAALLSPLTAFASGSVVHVVPYGL